MIYFLVDSEQYANRYTTPAVLTGCVLVKVIWDLGNYQGLNWILDL